MEKNKVEKICEDFKVKCDDLWYYLDKYNKVVLDNNDEEEFIYFMDYFDEYLNGVSPLEVAREVIIGKFNPYDMYFKIGISALESSNYLEELMYHEYLKVVFESEGI